MFSDNGLGDGLFQSIVPNANKRTPVAGSVPASSTAKSRRRTNEGEQADEAMEESGDSKSRRKAAQAKRRT